MYPQHVDSLYPLTILAASVVAVAVYARGLAASGVSRLRAVLAAAVVAGVGLLGGRLYWLIEQDAPVTLTMLLTTGYRHPGTLLGIVVAAPVARALLTPTISVGRLLDRVAPAAGFGWAVARVGCFLAGCCFGIRSELPWAVQFPDQSPPAQLHHFRNWLPDDVPGSLPVHPLQLYFLLLAFAAALFSLWFDRRRRYDGQTFLVFVAVHETGKFLLELLAETPLGTTPNWVPTMSLAAAMISGATLLLATRRRSTRLVPALIGR